MSILLIIGIILLISASSDWAAAKDWERSERNADQRHQEDMDLQRELHAELRRDIKKASRRRKKDEVPTYRRERRFIKDQWGNILGEEIVEERGDSSDTETNRYSHYTDLPVMDDDYTYDGDYYYPYGSDDDDDY